MVLIIIDMFAKPMAISLEFSTVIVQFVVTFGIFLCFRVLPIALFDVLPASRRPRMLREVWALVGSLWASKLPSQCVCAASENERVFYFCCQKLPLFQPLVLRDFLRKLAQKSIYSLIQLFINSVPAF